MVSKTEEQPIEEEEHPTAEVQQKSVKSLISPSSSFIDFVKLETEEYEEGCKSYTGYNPFEHRHTKKPISNIDTCIHMVKGAIGGGILTIPRAFQHSGWLLGIFGVFILASIYIYGVHVMIMWRNRQCKWLKVPFLTLPRALKIALVNGPKPLRRFHWLGPYAVDLFLVSNQVGLCSAYVLLVASCLKNILEPSVFHDVDKRFYILALYFPVLITNFIRNLKSLTPVSLIADASIFGALIICFYYIFGTGPLKMDETKKIGTLGTIPLFLGTVMFSLEAVGVMIVLEHHMKNPGHFIGRCGIFPWGTYIVSALYLFLGLTAYLRYAEDVQDTIMNTIPRNEWPSTAVQVMVGLSIFGSYPLQCYVALEIIFGNYLYYFIKNHNRDACYEYIMRTVVVTITFLVGIILPDVDLVISLWGSFSMAMLGLVIPFLLELCCQYPDYGCCYIFFFKDIFFIILGFVFCFIGVYASLYEIVTHKH